MATVDFEGRAFLSRLLRRMQPFTGLALILVTAIVVMLSYSSFDRPIWIDEYQHFSWGVFPDPWTAVALIVEPVVAGSAAVWVASSWTYFLVNVPLLAVFGASSIALRLPSLVAGVIVIAMGYRILRDAGFSWPWRWIAVLALGAQPSLMYYSGEARPYMPLAASVMIVAAYYNARLFGRSSKLLSSLAWIAVLTGSIGHVYFAFYLIALAALFTFLISVKPHVGLDLRERVNFANPILLCTGFAGFVLVQLRPLLGNQVSGYDPYYYMGGSLGGLVRTLTDTHIQFLPVPQIFAPIVFVAALLGLSILVISRRSRDEAWMLLPPLSLFCLAAAASFAISFSSIVGGYEIITRQWIVSLALLPVASVWFVASLVAFTSSRRPRLARDCAVIFAVVIAIMAFYRLQTQFELLQGYRSEARAVQDVFGDMPIDEPRWNALREELPNEEWANVNIYTGGPVWEVCGYFGCP